MLPLRAGALRIGNKTKNQAPRQARAEPWDMFDEDGKTEFALPPRRVGAPTQDHCIGPEVAMAAAVLPRYAPSRSHVDLWRLPLLNATFEQAIDEVERLIVGRQAGYFITANLNYAMLTEREPRLGPVNRDAAFILADGMPLVWYSRWVGRPLPQRVAGSDLIYALCRRAAQRGYRVFFLGGAPGVAEEAAG